LELPDKCPEVKGKEKEQIWNFRTNVLKLKAGKQES
jgi:hypothetical protein